MVRRHAEVVILSATKDLLLLDFDNSIFAVAQDDNLQASAWYLYCGESTVIAGVNELGYFINDLRACLRRVSTVS